MDFLQITEPHRQVIDQSLEHYIDALEESTPPTLHQAMKYSLLLPGKRVRPLLTLIACELCDGDTQEALPAACAIEMVHAFSLIHDDLPAMDDDDFRRGKPTNHKIFGEAQAILAGDALFAFAFEILSREVPSAVAAQCCTMLALASGPSGMGGGQSDDIRGLSDNSTEEDLSSLHRCKTGALIEASLQIGATIAKASEEQIAALLEYGWRIGLAFQIVDDVLDVTASSDDLGKTAGKDAKQGKVTYESLLGKEAAKSRAQELVVEAKQALDIFDDPGMLHLLADFVLNRNS